MKLFLTGLGLGIATSVLAVTIPKVVGLPEISTEPSGYTLVGEYDSENIYTPFLNKLSKVENLGLKNGVVIVSCKKDCVLFGNWGGLLVCDEKRICVRVLNTVKMGKNNASTD